MTVDLGKQQLLEGLTVFGDSDSFARFYVMPNQPRFRIDSDTKKPVLPHSVNSSTGLSSVEYKKTSSNPERGSENSAL